MSGESEARSAHHRAATGPTPGLRRQRGGGGAGPGEPTGERGAGMPGRVGVVDIGSNTVRLVVYDVPTRLPIPIFNEKAQCALGSGLGKSGRLNPKGVDEALRSLARFVRLAASDGRRPAGDGGDGGGARRQRRPRLRRSRRARVRPRRCTFCRAPRRRGSPRSACSTACRAPTACWAISAAAASIW